MQNCATPSSAQKWVTETVNKTPQRTPWFVRCQLSVCRTKTHHERMLHCYVIIWYFGDIYLPVCALYIKHWIKSSEGCAP